MARGRVPLESRRRSQRACSFCRMSKKRCDGASPCHNCARRGREASCVYTRYGSERREGAPRPAVPWTDNVDGPLSGRSTVEATDSSYPTPDASTARADPSSCSQYMHPRMLRNGTAGEKVYIGGSAALSFLQFLRATLKQYAGPSAFTESVTSYMMLEASVGGPAPGEFNEDLNHEGKAALVNCFIQASSGFLGIFTDKDVSELLETSDQSLNRPQSIRSRDSSSGGIWSHVDKQTSLYLMLAIGAQCRGHGDSDRRYSASYFSRAKQAVFQDSLLEPSLDMSVSFILMAFYMFCACRRNTASLYLGIASRAATILGLHSSELDQTLPPDVRGFRVRIWESLRVLDLHCNALLGRPSSTTHTHDQLSSDVVKENEVADHRMLVLDANFVLCSTIESISQTLTKTDSALDAPVAENYLKTLQDWSRALPEELRKPIRKDSREGVPDSKHREQTIGNLHVACGYYYTVMLVTRPFLVATIVPRLQKLHDQPSPFARGRSSSPQPLRSKSTPDPPREAVDGRQKSQQFAETCTGAASLLIQMCHDAATLGILFDNMCILQAWIFAAGLVLGFSLLAAPNPSANNGSDLKRSFTHSRQLLDKLSRLSPQARRLHEILSHFSDAVEWYEGQRRRQHQPSGPSYLEQILRPGGDTDEYPSTDTSRQSPGPSITVMPTIGDSQISTQNVTSGGTLAEQSSSVEAGSVDESFLWPHPPPDVLFAPEISDELGLQLPWDDYASQFTQDVASAGTCSRVPWNPLNANLNSG